MVGQVELVQAMHAYGLMFHLTEYPDLQSLVIQQAKKAGVITIASNVGGNSELIEHGHDGFIIDEHYLSQACEEKIKRLVARLTGDEEYAGYIRDNAKRHSLTWAKIAKDWIDHWDEVLRKKKKRKVLISGYYGFRNLGDEAILSCMIQDLRKAGEEINITVVSSDPFDTEKRHGVCAVPADDNELLAGAVRESDLFILGGGGLFQDYDEMKVSRFFDHHRYGASTVSYARPALMAKMYNKPVIYYAQGVGPLFSKESVVFARWAFDLADWISVRDKYSYFLLTELVGTD
jgi:hypothetical protein